MWFICHDFIIQEIIDYFYSKGTVIDFNNDADFLKFKESRKAENKLNRKSSINYKDVIINVYNFSYYAARKHTFSNLDKAVKFLEGCHKGIVTIDRDTPDNIKDIILKTPNPCYIISHIQHFFNAFQTVAYRRPAVMCLCCNVWQREPLNVPQ